MSQLFIEENKDLLLLSVFIVIIPILFIIITFIEGINRKPPKLKDLFKSKKY